MKICSLIFLLSLFSNMSGQPLPDKMEVTEITYISAFISEVVSGKKQFVISHQGNNYLFEKKKIKERDVLQFMQELDNRKNPDHSLSAYELDSIWIKTHPQELLNLYTSNYKISWNPQQKEYAFKKLTTISLLQKEMDELHRNQGCYDMHTPYRKEYEVKIFKGDQVIREIRSRKHSGSYKMPWTTPVGDTIYNYRLEAYLNNFLGFNYIPPPDKGEKLLKTLVKRILDNSMKDLYKLDAYSHQAETDKLKTDFQLISSERVYGYGRYTKSDLPVIKVVLANRYIPSNVRLIFMATVKNGQMHSTDAIKEKYKSMIDRLQAVDFIRKHLQEHPQDTLDMYFYDDGMLSDGPINEINGNPHSWKICDDRAEAVKQGLIHSDETRVQTAMDVYCGCNYRFAENFIKQGIFFEMREKEKTSLWLLLPDNTALLYIMDGDGALHISRKDMDERKEGMLYVCGLFDTNGNQINKKK